jgi:hypothetical protein
MHILTLILLIAVLLIAALAYIFRAKIIAAVKNTDAFRSWRKSKLTNMYQACIAAKHKLDPGAVGDKPAKICSKCNYIVQISKQEFKSLFGISHTMMKLRYEARLRRDKTRQEAEAVIARIEAKAQAAKTEVKDAIAKAEGEIGGAFRG